ncbi:hypothetical protein N7526_001751 [Penicillium atrosanguineum]|nr:hypothetical protein N7526_001751 [Penicillium atrosanguineum]
MYRLAVIGSILSLAIPTLGLCRCRPHESCWSSFQDWLALNNSIQGQLVSVRPVAAKCSNVSASWPDPFWRAAEPSAVQWENWEAWPERNQTCYIEDRQNTTCGQGRVSLYPAKVESTSQIQETVAFVKRHNLRLVIKNSGHDFLGRPSAPESLQISTHATKDIENFDKFMPTGALKDGVGEGPAITIAAGVSITELYAAVSRHNRSVIAGASGSIGAGGGYFQGGGHSVFGVWRGLA